MALERDVLQASSLTTKARSSLKYLAIAGNRYQFSVLRTYVCIFHWGIVNQCHVGDWRTVVPRERKVRGSVGSRDRKEDLKWNS